MKLKLILPSLTFAAVLAVPAAASAQEVIPSSTPIVIEPLFEYPMAPDSIPDLTGKSEWIVEHFWDKMDFKGKTAVDQNALNDAVQVFISPMRWTSDPVIDKALNTLFKNLEKNPTLSLQFTRAAEEALYGPRAIYWSDPVYLQFIDHMLRNKKIPAARKERFIRHKRLLENSRVGDYPKPFDYTTVTGTTAKYAPTGVITVIEFGDPECDDCRLAKLKMETDVTFSGLVDKGAVNVMFIIPDPSDGWQTGMVDFSPKWHVGASDTVADIYDIRATPSFYVIGRDGKIIAKNVNYRQAMGEAVKAANASEPAK